MTVFEALRDPALFPHRPTGVEVVETHISVVFLAGDRVYKLKKPVRYDFVDYSTLERRKFFCEEEVRLNRRLAPDVYRGTAPLYLDEERWSFTAPRSGAAPAEFAVEMRRLARDDMLDRRLLAGRAGESELRAIAETLARFHAAASTARADEFGRPEAIARTLLDNARSGAALAAEAGVETRARDLADRLADRLSALRPELARRPTEGRVREGHGDLRAEHVALAPSIAIVDCVEFSEELRTNDVASEIAFLAMDLDALGFPVLAEDFAADYARRTHDEGMAALLPVYRCYRAQVRAKVEALRARGASLDAPARDAAHEAVRRYLRLARRSLGAARPAELVAVGGLSGSGKSTVARIARELTGFPVLSSDVVRKDLAGIPRTERVPAERTAEVYGTALSQRTYDALGERAAALLRAGRGAIVDATFQEELHRARLRAVAAAARVPIRFLECAAPPGEIRRRLAARARDRDEVSDATWDVHVAQSQRFERFRDDPDHTRIDTGTDLATLGERVERALDL